MTQRVQWASEDIRRRRFGRRGNRRHRSRLAQTLGLTLLLAACQTSTSDSDSAPARFADLQGAEWSPLEVDDATAHVLLFVTTDCPIANSYAPEIHAIVEDYRGQPVRFFVVHVDPDVTADQARAHARDYDLPGPILRDPRHQLVQHLGIRTTPEAALLGASGALVYRGRIDNWWGDLGRKRPRATRHDLRDALDAVLAGRFVQLPFTRAIGCDLPVL